VSVLFVQRHINVSAWLPFLLMIYPIWETIFSAYRRRVHGKRASSGPDQLHLHTLTYKRFTGEARAKHHNQRATDSKRNATQHDQSDFAGRRNSDVTVYLWMMAGAADIPAVLYWNHSRLLIMSALVFIVAYLLFYRVLLRFKLMHGYADTFQMPDTEADEAAKRIAARHAE
jgi:UDP-N-acetylmuramyl pentapeptide phosphotransferase/UDP-N-acetylglucosamine-1-phosphate transferase